MKRFTIHYHHMLTSKFDMILYKITVNLDNTLESQESES
jgi:hypothetical protein